MLSFYQHCGWMEGGKGRGREEERSFREGREGMGQDGKGGGGEEGREGKGGERGGKARQGKGEGGKTYLNRSHAGSTVRKQKEDFHSFIRFYIH